MDKYFKIKIDQEKMNGLFSILQLTAKNDEYTF